MRRSCRAPQSTASPTLNAIFGAILGLVLGCILVKALEGFDRRLRSPVVEAEYGLPLLASIPFSSQGSRGHAVGRAGARFRSWRAPAAFARCSTTAPARPTRRGPCC